MKLLLTSGGISNKTSKTNIISYQDLSGQMYAILREEIPNG